MAAVSEISKEGEQSTVSLTVPDESKPVEKEIYTLKDTLTLGAIGLAAIGVSICAPFLLDDMEKTPPEIKNMLFIVSMGLAHHFGQEHITSTVKEIMAVLYELYQLDAKEYNLIKENLVNWFIAQSLEI